MRRTNMLCLLALGAIAGSARADQTITLLHVNDTHSHLSPWGPKDENLDGTLGGLARAATIVLEQKATSEGPIFVHHGDLFFDDFMGVPELQTLQGIGLDVFTPGNHEFQFGPDFLAFILGQALPPGAVPIVGTNLTIPFGHPLLDYVHPYLLKDVNGVQVGFFGLTTPDDPLAMPGSVVIEADLTGIAQHAVSDLRASGAQLVVCIAHLGMTSSRALATNVPGIDVIVNGHDHVALAQPEVVEHAGGAPTIIVSAGDYYRWVGKLVLSVGPEGVTGSSYELLSVDPSVLAWPDVQALVTYLQGLIVDRHGDVYHQVVGWAGEDIPSTADGRHAKRDSAVGDLFTDAYRAWTGTDIAIEANGFLDEGLPAGALVPIDFYRTMGYEMPSFATGAFTLEPFRLVTFSIRGDVLLVTLNAVVGSGGDVFPQVSGMRFEYDSSSTSGEPILADSVHIGGRRLDPEQMYSVTANEGVVFFLHQMEVPIAGETTLSDSAVDAAIALVESRGVIDAATSGRIRDVANRGPDH